MGERGRQLEELGAAVETAISADARLAELPDLLGQRGHDLDDVGGALHGIERDEDHEPSVAGDAVSREQVFGLDGDHDLHGGVEDAGDAAADGDDISHLGGVVEVQVVDGDEGGLAAGVPHGCDRGGGFHPAHDLAAKGDADGVGVTRLYHVGHLHPRFCDHLEWRKFPATAQWIGQSRIGFRTKKTRRRRRFNYR